MSKNSNYVSLHNHSHFSLLDSTAKIEDAVKRAKDLGHRAYSLTDHGNVYGHIQAYRECQKHGIKFIPGIEAYFTHSHEERQRKSNHLTVLAKNNAGLENLYKMITWSNVPVDKGGGFFYRPRISWKELEKFNEGLIILTGCMSSPSNKAFVNEGYEQGKDVVKRLKSIFGADNLFVELQRVNDDNNIYIPEQELILENCRQVAQELGLRSVATNDGHYIYKDDCFPHEVLKAIEAKATLETPVVDHSAGITKGRLVFNGFDYYIRSEEEMLEKFSEEEVSMSQEIADMVDIDFDMSLKMPKYKGMSDKDCMEELKKMARKGWVDLKIPNTQEYRDRIEKELSEIEEAELQHYFMIVYDVCKFCDENNISRGYGRGSCAGSLILYLLKVTRFADPVKNGLIWERFYNIGRKGSMPDIDLDIQIDKREDVVNYLKQEFGKDRVFPMMTITTMTTKSVIKDVGKVIGLSHEYLNNLTKNVKAKNNGLTDAIESSEVLQKAQLGIDKDVEEWSEQIINEKSDFEKSELQKKINDRKRKLQKTFKVARRLEGVNRNRSTHACAILISDQSVFGKIPCSWDANKKTLLTGFDMYDIERLGYMKLDVLGLKTLSVVSRTMPNFMDKVSSFDDEDVFNLISRGNNKGVFQLESKLGEAWSRRVKPKNIEDLAALISLIRPAVLETGLASKYIENRKRGSWDCIHEDLEPIFKSTYGIMLYQEQMLEVAKKFGGFDLREADSLRKAVGKKIPELMATFKDKFIDACTEKYDNSVLADELWSWIEKGAEYSFNKSHALTYGMMAYTTAYAKLYHPLEFYCSMLQMADNEQKPQEEIAEIFYDAKLRGVEILPPSMLFSEDDFSISKNKIYFGLNSIKKVGKSSIRDIKEIAKNCDTATEYILAVSSLKKDVSEALCFSGALDFLNVDRMKIFSFLNLMKALTKKERAILSSIVIKAGHYDASTARSTKIVEIPIAKNIDDAYVKFKDYIQKRGIEDKIISHKRSEKILETYEENDRINSGSEKEHMLAAKELMFLGIPIKYCEVDIYDHKDKTHSIINIKKEMPGKRFRTIAVLSRVTQKQDRNGRRMAFISMTDKTYMLDGIVFADVFEKSSKQLKVGNVVLINGKLSYDGSPIIDSVDAIC